MAHFDVHAEVQRRHLQDRVIITGYLETDEELTDHLAACDVSLNLRWPTARETSGPWLRALAAGTPDHRHRSRPHGRCAVAGSEDVEDE